MCIPNNTLSLQEYVYAHFVYKTISDMHSLFGLDFFLLFKNLFPTSYHKTQVNSEIKMQFQIRESTLLVYVKEKHFSK